MNVDDLDGRIGEGWGGEKPNGSHVNVVLARRGSPTAAAALSMLANPSPGHTPVLVTVGATGRSTCSGRFSPQYLRWNSVDSLLRMRILRVRFVSS